MQRHPIFARVYPQVARRAERAGGAEHRRRLLAGLRGQVIEVGAGNGLNFPHYPPTVTRVLAVEPEPYLRARAARSAAAAPVPIELIAGDADALPAGDGEFDAAVASLVLCSVPDQASALSELARVLKPGGELRFYEHVRSDRALARWLQRLLDATVYPPLSGGCHCARDTVRAISESGFVVERVEPAAFQGAEAVTHPHVLGIARARARLQDNQQQKTGSGIGSDAGQSGQGEIGMTDFAVVNPATGETIKEYPTITADELEAAIAAADRCQREWIPTTTVSERAALIRRVGELHSERRDELAAIIVREMGKPVEQALGEVDFCQGIYDYYADNAENLLADEPITLLDGEGSAVIRRSPYGVLLGIMPWNFPYYQVARFAGPNLIIGNTILLKHAPQCPESALAIAEMYEQAGFPPGAYNNIFAVPEQIESVIADPRVRGVSLTGSERAGAAVAQLAGKHLKKVVLELGGSDPFILLSTDDLDATVEAAVAARLDNTGQSCNAAKRFIVIDELYEPFLEKFTAAMSAVTPGDPTSSETAIGPLSSSTAAERLDSQVQAAISQGAKVAARAGERNGNFYPPTVLTDIGPDNVAYREELFGPVAQVYRVSSEDEAVRLANDTRFGLGSYLFTTDPEQAERVANRIEAGMVYVNLVGADSAELPFGGVKASGFGRELGRYGADEFVNKKLIRVG